VNKVLIGESPDGNYDGLQELIHFDGNFECANIDQVRKRGNCVYDIFMRNDSYGSGCLQLFIFRMKNLNGWTGLIRLNIVNFTKESSLFQQVIQSNLFCRVCNLVSGQN